MKYTKLLGSVALAALLSTGFTGCDSDDKVKEAITEVKENIPEEIKEAFPADEGKIITPYQRVAVIPGTWDDVNNIALQIAQYAVDTDEKEVLGFPSNWVIAGANPDKGETYDGLADLLPIPAVGGKSRVIEFCNGKYATMATNTGRFHGSALPCEVSVHSDGENIYVDMLDADAIFSIFFTDISDPDGNLEAVASAVKSELRTMILTSLSDQAVTESTLQMGPEFTPADVEAISYTNPYIVYKYQSKDGSAFEAADARTLASEIIAKLGTDAATADTNVPGVSSGSKWRSGRPEPIAIPGVQVVEACSPKYAAKATKLGSEYITALPCEITAYIDENDATGKTIAISFLNPNFMFGTMFKGSIEKALAAGTITKDDVIEYSTIADVVFGDLRLIVDAAITDSSLNLEVQ